MLKKVNVTLLVTSVVLVVALVFTSIHYASANQVEPIQGNDIESFILKNTYCNDGTLSGVGDPYMVTDNGKYYMTSTGDSTSFKLYASTNLVDWEYVSLIYTMSQDNAWSIGKLWQPQIVKKDGKYYLYYTGETPEGSLRIGVAVSDTIDGVYTDVQNKPLFDFGYAVIDPHVFIDDDGKIYMYYSRDCSENKVNGVNTSQIFVVEMDNMTTITAKQGHLVSTPELDWEKASGKDFQWNEGPDILKHNDKYYLFYSVNFFDSRAYSIGYSISDSPMGPFKKQDHPVLTSEYEQISGTGNNSFFYSVDGKELFTAYHSHLDPLSGTGSRALAVDRCGFREDGTFYINGPTKTPQLLPDSEDLHVIRDGFRVTADKTAENRDAKALCDGVVECYTWNESYEWAGDAKSTIKISFDKPTEIKGFFIYSSVLPSRQVDKLTIEFDDGSQISPVVCGKAGGEASIIHFQTKTVKEIKISVKDVGNAEAFGLSEIQMFR